MLPKCTKIFAIPSSVSLFRISFNVRALGPMFSHIAAKFESPNYALVKSIIYNESIIKA